MDRQAIRLYRARDVERGQAMKLACPLAALLVALSSAEFSNAATHTATVASVTGNIAKVTMIGDVLPRPGTRAEIFFKMAGFEEEIVVATGSSFNSGPGEISIIVEDASGTVEQGHLVRFGPPSPTTPIPSSPKVTPPTPALASSIVGNWTGNEPGGDQISFTFNADGTVSYIRQKGKKKNILRGNYRTDCAASPCRLELYRFTVNGVSARGETIIGLFELHESEMKFDLSSELQGHPEKGFTKGMITLVRARLDTASPKTTSTDEMDVPNTFEEAQSVIESRKPSPRPSPHAATTGFAGEWKVQNEEASYTLRLRQDGNRVSGSYDLYNGALTGTVRAGILLATWDQPGNRRGGSARLRLSADGQLLTGSWAYDPTIYSSGLKGSGTWTFRRIKP